MEIINKDSDDNEARISQIKTLLAASDTFAGQDDLSSMAINYVEYVSSNNDKKYRERYSKKLDLLLAIKRQPVLNFAIKKQDAEIATLLFHHVLETKALAEHERQQVLITALMCCSAEKNEDMLIQILDSGAVDINKQDESGIYPKSYLISCAAANKASEIVKLLLRYGADPEQEVIDADSIDDPKLSIALQCGKELAAARRGYEQGDIAALYTHLAQAIEHDIQFIIDYCKTQAKCAVEQSDKNHLRYQYDKTDYRFLLEFNKVIAIILQSPLNQNNRYTGYPVFQQEVLPVFYSYHFDTDIATSLFKSNETLNAYLTTPNAKPLIEGASFEGTRNGMSGSDNDDENSGDTQSQSSEKPSGSGLGSNAAFFAGSGDVEPNIPVASTSNDAKV